MKNISFKYLIFMLSIGILGSCGSGEEGCLDISATNYDVSADVSCASCCTYPALSMRINHRMDSVTFALNSVYHDASGTPFTVAGVQFYVSDLKLVKSDGSTVGVTDELTLTFSDNTIMDIEDNFALYEKSIGTYSPADFGTISTSGNFTKIQFYVGVTPFANHAEPSKMPSGHPLAIQSDTMHWNLNDGYIFNKIQIVKDTSSTNITTFEIGNDGNLVFVELDYPQTIQRGFNIALALNLDYAQLFSGIQFQTDDDAAIKAKIISNTASAFSVSN